MVLTSEHEHPSRWAALVSVSSKIGCTPETLRAWVNKMEVDSGKKPGVTSDASITIKSLKGRIESSSKPMKSSNRQPHFLLRRSSTETQIVQFIDNHRALHGVEPICRM